MKRQRDEKIKRQKMKRQKAEKDKKGFASLCDKSTYSRQ